MKTENTFKPKPEFRVYLQRTFCLAESQQLPLRHQPVPSVWEIPPGVSSCLTEENDATKTTTTKPDVFIADKCCRSRCSHAGNHFAESNLCQWHCAVTHSSYKKEKSCRENNFRWCKTGAGEKEGGESRSESESPESLFHVSVII